MPLEGDNAWDHQMLNPTAAWILDQVRSGRQHTAIVDDLHRQHPDTPIDRLSNDVKDCLIHLYSLGVYEMTEPERTELLTTGAYQLSGLHVMDEPEVVDVAAKLHAAIQGTDTRASILYSAEQLDAVRYEAHYVRARHIALAEAVFTHRNDEGKIDGVVTLMAPRNGSVTQTIGLIAAFAGTKEVRIDVAARMLRDLEVIVHSLFCALKLRLMVKVYRGVCPEGTQESRPTCSGSAEIMDVLDQCGFRREACLTNESGPGIDIEFLTRCITA